MRACDAGAILCAGGRARLGLRVRRGVGLCGRELFRGRAGDAGVRVCTCAGVSYSVRRRVRARE